MAGATKVTQFEADDWMLADVLPSRTFVIWPK